MTSLVVRLRPMWGDEAGGTLWLGAAVASNFAFGLLLQLMGLRSLTATDYSLFVAGLGVGNVGSAVAATVQPVVAVRAGDVRATFLPAEPARLVVVAAALMGLGELALARTLGALPALVVLMQLPLYAVVGVGLGRLQASRSFVRMAICLASWSIVRVAAVVPSVVMGNSSGLVFLVSLLAGHLVELALLLAFDAYRDINWHTADDSRRLLAHYGLFAIVAWLLNADAIYARVFLSPQQAGDYAIAFTLGRQPVYAVAPLVTVLLPVTMAGGQEEQRARFWAIAAAAGLLFLATLATIGVWPAPILQLLAGRSDAVVEGLVRGYALVGSLAAAATLLVTFLFALGCEPRLGFVGGLAIVCLVTVLIAVRQPWQLLMVQGSALGLLVTMYGWLGLRATQSLSPAWHSESVRRP